MGGFVLAVSMAAAVGCGDDDDDDTTADPSVVVSGNSSVAIGETLALTAATSNGTDTGYTWSSANNAIATVSATGVVTGVAAGETRITATGNDTGASDAHNVVVLPADQPALPRVTVTAPSVFLGLGETVTVTGATTNGTDASYNWTSSDTNVAMVDATGATATVTATRELDDAEFVEVTITGTGATTGASDSITFVVGVEVPQGVAWAGSGHADSESEAFRHWDSVAEDPCDGDPTAACIPTSCAKCHSTAGLLDFYGADGATLETVDEEVPAASVVGVECAACHSQTINNIGSVVFPSGDRIEQFSEFAGVQTCMSCHQGRSSTPSVDSRITNPGAPDTVQGDLGFSNIHYYAAAATIFAGEVRGGYQYDGEVYDWRFRHVPVADNCVGCHDPHSLQLKTDTCSQCHTEADPTEIRMVTSREDFDGDGLCPTDDCTANEPIRGEVETLVDMLYDAIQLYANEVDGAQPICRGTNHPYWFIDVAPLGGECGAGDTARYNTFTPRLAKAAYNHQVAYAEPGGFAHNAKYVIQLLHDSIIDLNTGIVAVGGTPMDTSMLVRNDRGHFNGAGEAARHWDEDAEVSASCSTCHAGSEGFRAFIETGTAVAIEDQANGLDCATCHANTGSSELGERPDEGPWAIRGGPVTMDGMPFIPFPGAPTGTLLTTGDTVSDMCSTCHAGRSSAVQVDAAIGATAPNSPMTPRGFINIHYKAAGVTRFGTDANGGAEFPGKTYAGRDGHAGTFSAATSQCAFCHDPGGNEHSFDPNDLLGTGETNDCARSGCHGGITDVEEIRFVNLLDYDGDGSAEEPLAEEIGYLGPGDNVNACFTGGAITDDTCGLSDRLLVAMNVYASANGRPGICYKPDAYPYFTVDNNRNSVCDAEDVSAYRDWTPSLLRAAYNYQLSHTEPGAWAHNFRYVGQLLYDSLEAMGAPLTGLTRP